MACVTKLLLIAIEVLGSCVCVCGITFPSLSLVDEPMTTLGFGL